MRFVRYRGRRSDAINVLFGAVTEKIHFPRLSIVLETESFCKLDYLSCYVMFDRHRIPAIIVGWCIASWRYVRIVHLTLYVLLNWKRV